MVREHNGHHRNRKKIAQDHQSRRRSATVARARVKDRMWPLDLMLAALAAMVLFLILTNLSFTDQRLLHNATTYTIGVPVFAFAMAFVLRGLASHYVQKSIQIGFLFSVSLHLLLLMLATGVVIFNRFYPSTVMGVKPERSPVRRTVPEYLFKTTEKRDAQPDWSKPTDAETASKVMPREERKIPPVDRSATLLEMPQPKQPIRKRDRQHLIPRERPAESLPQPSNSPAKMARQRTSNRATGTSLDGPPVPTVPQQGVEASLETAQPNFANPTRSRSSAEAEIKPAQIAQKTTSTSISPNRLAALEGQRRREQSQPRIGDQGFQRRSGRPYRSRVTRPAGAAPAPSTIAMARVVEIADRLLAPVETIERPKAKQQGARLTMGSQRSVPSNQSPTVINPTVAAQADAVLHRMSASVGMPNVNPAMARRLAGRSRRARGGTGVNSVGAPIAGAIANAATGLTELNADSDIDSSLDQLDDSIGGRSRQVGRAMAEITSRQSIRGSTASMTMDLLADEGPMGLGQEINRVTGVVPADESPQIAALDLTTQTRRRKAVGGPINPFGTKIAAVESFSRRVMRTKGGRAPTPAGAVGPATEEAIERGLAYLKSIQNDDGSWSLQGHGTKVVLQSDSAATGLCLLAFQGAGYTHKQHQYASTVSRGLAFLIKNQESNGNLYRPENPISDRNVAFYSHGIAALAMSEAYGMTQDPDLKEPAQMSLNFIANTQNRSRGGWRYTAQVSADTSVTGWMMMALKSGQLSGLEVPQQTYQGIDRWLNYAQVSTERRDRYRYDPFAPDTPKQRHGRFDTPTMTAVGMLMRMYSGWKRDNPHMQSAAKHLLQHPPNMGTEESPQRDGYYWYYATQVMFHMGGDYWEKWNRSLSPVLLESQLKDGPYAGSWDPIMPVRDRWSVHAGRLYVTTMNLLNLEVYYRHLPIYEETAE